MEVETWFLGYNMYADKDLDMPDRNLWRITADHENNFLFVYIFSVWKNKVIHLLTQKVVCSLSK